MKLLLLRSNLKNNILSHLSFVPADFLLQFFDRGNPPWYRAMRQGDAYTDLDSDIRVTGFGVRRDPFLQDDSARSRIARSTAPIDHMPPAFSSEIL